MSELKQAIYHHGGSRIWIESDSGERQLIVDTYLEKDFAEGVMAFVRNWIAVHGASAATPAADQKDGSEAMGGQT